MSQFENDTCDPTTRDDIFKRLWEKIKMVMQRPLVWASKFLVPIVKDALWGKSELKELKSSRSTRKPKRKLIS